MDEPEIEKVETIHVTIPDNRFEWSYSEPIAPPPPVPYICDLRGGYVKECLINGKPYYCGSPRRFEKASFMAVVEQLTKRSREDKPND